MTVYGMYFVSRVSDGCQFSLLAKLGTAEIKKKSYEPTPPSQKKKTFFLYDPKTQNKAGVKMTVT